MTTASIARFLKWRVAVFLLLFSWSSPAQPQTFYGLEDLDPTSYILTSKTKVFLKWSPSTTIRRIAVTFQGSNETILWEVPDSPDDVISVPVNNEQVNLLGWSFAVAPYGVSTATLSFSRSTKLGLPDFFLLPFKFHIQFGNTLGNLQEIVLDPFQNNLPTIQAPSKIVVLEDSIAMSRGWGFRNTETQASAGQIEASPSLTSWENASQPFSMASSAAIPLRI